MDTSWVNFIGLLLFGSLVLASTVVFFAWADMNYRVAYTGSTDDFREVELTREFHALPDHQRAIFNETLESGRYVSDDPLSFPETVKKNETYYQFRTTTAFDWADHRTYVPTLSWLFGMAGVIAVLRRDVRQYP